MKLKIIHITLVFLFSSIMQAQAEECEILIEQVEILIDAELTLEPEGNNLIEMATALLSEGREKCIPITEEGFYSAGMASLIAARRLFPK